MILIPALLIMDGKVVRLREGRRDQPVVRAEDPLRLARDLRLAGVDFLHLVDLDSVFGNGDNNAVIEALVENLVGCQVGGGIRTPEQAEQLLTLGVDRVVIGTLFFDQPEAARDLVARFGMRVMAALDVEDGEVRTHGWEQGSGHSLPDALALLTESGVRHVIYRRIDRSGGELGPDVDGTRDVVRSATELNIYAQTLARTGDDVDALRVLTDDGLVGVILGQAEQSLEVVEVLAQV